ncbi:hypothetical protein C8P66_10531 [Humitalea rosea]|uniref:Uncharacterized protein n=1 Tax=Humitalea rosea TaxID=990373 RepID=A0A2W7IRS2_9PROT|nr:hypothetical protein [Humitalea rosea]PZW48284.1 hypothetical protein C8P66_10531 [Humitalea rosea]
MPNFDGGHYFLTVLVPVREELVADPRVAGIVTSHVEALRQVLVALPTALQTPATEQIGLNSPFARDRRTHFARFTVIDDVAFNGRGQRDPIKVALLGPKPWQTDPVDALPCAYLLFVADFDAASGDVAELDSYLTGLWAVMAPELREILIHCRGHDRLTDAAGVCRLIRDCQVETTMPFNDYWSTAPSLPTLDIKSLLIPVAVAAVVLLLGIVVALFGGRAGIWLLVAGLVGLVLTVFLAWRRVVAAGMAPFPTAPRSDLPSVLKALYLQQQFIRFAIRMQGAEPAALHAGFGDFLRQHRPEDVAAPSQHAGTVRS